MVKTEAPDAHARDYYTDQLSNLDRFDYSDRAQKIFEGYASVVQEPDGMSERDWKADLELAWQDQSQRLLELGLNRELGMSKEKYLSSLPKFASQPPDFEGRLDVPVLVDPRISLEKLLEVGEIANGISSNDEISDWPDNGFVMPDRPYSTWIGVREGRGLISEMRQNLMQDERGSTALEVAYYYLYNPDIMKVDPYWGSTHLLMIGSQNLSNQGYSEGTKGEMRLYLGHYFIFNGEIGITNNGDPAYSSSGSGFRQVIVGRE